MTDQTVPTRLLVLQGLTGVLKGITPANGYVFDMSDFTDDGGQMRERVFRGRNQFGDSDPDSLLSILENPHTEPNLHQSPKWSPILQGPWMLLLQGKVSTNFDDAHIFMADVKKALAIHRGSAQSAAPNLFGAGRVVHDYIIGSGIVRPPDDWSIYNYFWLMLTLDMTENMSNPYA